MRAIDLALCKALPLSLLLHAILFAALGDLVKSDRPVAATSAEHLDVTIIPRKESAQSASPIFLDDSPATALPPPARPHPARQLSTQVAQPAYASPAAPGESLTPLLDGAAARQANAQLARELLYPPEAIARGLEGQALVLLFLDTAGTVIAARLEASSGHPLLDDAAIHAARRLHSLPDSAPREALLPVRFRLR